MLRYSIVFVAIGLVVWASWSLFRKRTPAEKLAALQKEVAPKGGEIFETELQGRHTAFLVMNCEVFLLDITGKKVKRTKVLKTGFYFGLTVCTGHSIRLEEGYVQVMLANRAIGAGGGNTSGGYYRSRDGLTWEKETRTGWKPLDEAQP